MQKHAMRSGSFKSLIDFVKFKMLLSAWTALVLFSVQSYLLLL